MLCHSDSRKKGVSFFNKSQMNCYILTWCVYWPFSQTHINQWFEWENFGNKKNKIKVYIFKYRDDKTNYVTEQSITLPFIHGVQMRNCYFSSTDCKYFDIYFSIYDTNQNSFSLRYTDKRIPQIQTRSRKKEDHSGTVSVLQTA